MTSQDVQEFVAMAAAISRGTVEGEVLARQAHRMTVRTGTGGVPVIVKLWSLRNLNGLVRRVLRRTKGRAEWKTLRLLRDSSVPVPEVLAYFPLRGAGVRHQEVLVVEDLAPCEPLHKYLHACSKHGDRAEVERVGGEIIRITAGMLRAGVADNDHRIGNFVMREDGRVYRLDFENARLVRAGDRGDDLVGVMIGALVSSHAWITRFKPEQTPRFVAELLEEVRLSDRALERARSAAESEITWLRNRSGFTVSQNLGL
jgi:tRNA A-37 threonylcarbamoyl transferase component Bud32